MPLKARLACYGVVLLVVSAVIGGVRCFGPVDLRQPPEPLERVRQEEARWLGPENPPSPESFHPFQVVDRQPLVTDFEIVLADDARERVDEDELVLAVAIDGVARAYPLNIMTGPEREVFNDELSGEPIAATW